MEGHGGAWTRVSSIGLHFAAFIKLSAASAASCRASFSESEKYFPTARESSELGRQHGSEQIPSTQQGFRLCSALSSLGPVWLGSLSAFLSRGPRPGRKEAEPILPETATRALPAEPGCSQPSPPPASPHAFISCPASLTSFLKQLTRARPLSPCSATQLFSQGRTPSTLLPTNA